MSAPNQIIAPNPYDVERQNQERKRKFLEAALAGAMAPRQGHMAGQVYVGGENFGTALTKVLGGFLQNKLQKDSKDQEMELANRYQRDLENSVNQYIQGPATREGAVRAFVSPFQQMQALGGADLEKLRAQDTPFMRMLNGGMQPQPQAQPTGEMAPGAAPMAPPPQGTPLGQAPQQGGSVAGFQVPPQLQQLFQFMRPEEIQAGLMADPSGKELAKQNFERGKQMKLGPEDMLMNPTGVGQFAPVGGMQQAQVAHVGNVARERERAKAMYDLAPPVQTPEGVAYPTRMQMVQGANAPGPQTLGPAQGNKFTPEEFVRQYGPVAQQVGQQLGVNPEILLGQWGLETGWGEKIIPGTNNLGNIKDFGGKGPKARDNMTGSVDSYRQYQDPNGFGKDYADLISRRYAGAMGAGGDVAKFGQGLKGYAEDPNYAQKLQGASQTAARAMSGAGVGGAKAPGLFVPYNEAQKSTDQKAREADLKFVTESRENAAKAGEALQAIQQIKQAVGGGSFAGAFGTVQERVAAFASALGVPVDQNKLSNTQYVQALLKTMALPLNKMLGANPTDTDRKYIDQALGQITNDPAAFDRLIGYLEQKSTKDVEKFQAMDSYFREKGSLRGFDYKMTPPKQQQNLPNAQQLGLPPGFKVLRRID